MPLTHFDRYATITIQGGGVYGLNLLGQLAAMVDEFEIIPIALAGNSAGAIIATLYWAGLSPELIKEKFQEACEPASGKGRTRLMELLGPFESNDGETFDFDKFLEMKHRFDGYLSTLDSQLMTGDETGRRRRAKSLTEHVEQFCLKVAALLQLRRATRDISPHAKNNGLFRGNAFEETIDRWVRESPRLAKFFRESELNRRLPSPVGKPGGRLLTFADLARLQDREGILFQPLFLTATNLTRRRLEVINSFEARYAHWPIARAVRASAGFPVFFRPVAVEGRHVGCWYVDGGLISNFPSWVFGPKFRSSLTSKESSAYDYFSSFPWLNIGLRVVDDTESVGREDDEIGPGPHPEPMPPHPLKPKDFLDSLVSLVTGRARNEIEGILSTFVSRSRTVLQPITETSGPENLLSFHQVDAARVAAMFDSGRVAARGSFADVDYRLPGEDKRGQVVGLLGTMADRAWAILRAEGMAVDARRVFRANVYLPQGEMLLPWCTWNMDGSPDADLGFRLGSGLTGFCHARRRPLLGNLKMIGEEFRRGGTDAIEFFRMENDQQVKVAGDRTWLASFPIFDPGDTGLHQAPVALSKPERPYYCEVASPVEAGGVFGVLNLDGVIDHERLGLHAEPIQNLTDHRIASIIAIAQAAAFQIGQVLSESYPNSLSE